MYPSDRDRVKTTRDRNETGPPFMESAALRWIPEQSPEKDNYCWVIGVSLISTRRFWDLPAAVELSAMG